MPEIDTLGGQKAYQNTILPLGWNTGWTAAKGTVATGPVGVAFVGDSITQGFQADRYFDHGYKGLVRSSLITQFGLYGDFFALYESLDYVNTLSGGTYGQTPPWSVVAAPAGVARSYLMLGFTLVPLWLSGAVAQGTTMATLIPPYNSNAVDLLWWNLGAGGGTWFYAIDGVNQAGVAHANPAGLARLQLRNLGAGNHTITLNGQSAGLAMSVIGAMCYNTQSGIPPANGLWFGHLAYGGASLADIGNVRTNTNPTDKIAQFTGLASEASLLTPPIGASLLINAYIAGDANIFSATNPNGLDFFMYNQRRLLQAFRRANPNVSQLFVIPYIPDQYYTDDAPAGFSRTQNYHQWITRKQNIAFEETLGLIDFQPVFGQTPVANGNLVANAPHPTTQGHQTMANAILPLL